MIKLLENKPDIEGFYRTKGYIYIVKDNSKHGHYKIGLSEAPDKRVIGLNCSSSTNSLEIVDTYKTNDSILAEKIIHSILFCNKIKKQKEWFYVQNEEILQFIKKVIINSIEFSNNYIFNSIEDEIQFLNNYKKINVKMISINTQTEIKLPKVKIQKEIEPIIEEINLKDKDEIIFDNFFKNCCKMDDTFYCTKKDIVSQYKTWSKMNSIYNTEKFENYLLKKFNIKKKYHKLFETEMISVLGIKLNDSFYTFTFEEPFEELEQFLIDSCIKLPTAKLNRSSIKDVYEKWCKEKNKKIINTNSTINKLCQFIDKYFFKDLFYNGDSSYHGWYGITLKENFLQGTGLNNTMCKKIKVYKIYKENPKEIIKEWKSIKEASFEFNMNYSTLRNRIKQKVSFTDKNNKDFYLLDEEQYNNL